MMRINTVNYKLPLYLTVKNTAWPTSKQLFSYTTSTSVSLCHGHSPLLELSDWGPESSCHFFGFDIPSFSPVVLSVSPPQSVHHLIPFRSHLPLILPPPPQNTVWTCLSTFYFYLTSSVLSATHAFMSWPCFTELPQPVFYMTDRLAFFELQRLPGDPSSLPIICFYILAVIGYEHLKSNSESVQWFYWSAWFDLMWPLNT